MIEKEIHAVIEALKIKRKIEWRRPREGSFDELSYNAEDQNFIWVERTIYEETKVTEYTEKELQDYLFTAKHITIDYFSSLFTE